MVPADDFRDGVPGPPGGRKHILPVPLSCCTLVLGGEGVWKDSFAETFGEVFLMDCVDLFEMELKSFFDGRRENCYAILVSFSASHKNSILCKVDIFDTESEALEESESGPVEEVTDEPIDSCESGDDLFGFVASERFGYSFWTSGPDGFCDGSDFFVEDFLVEKEDSIEGEVLGGGSDVFFDGEVGEKILDFLFRHFRGVTFPIKENVAFNPMDVSVLGAAGEVFKLHLVPHLIQQLRWIHRDLRRANCG